jgi:hypothetical protein
MMRYRWMPGVVVTALLTQTAAASQDKPAPQATQARPATQTNAPSESSYTPLKMTIVIARYQGDKKISSLPYVFGVTANSGKTTSVRMGSDVPLVTRAAKGDTAASYNYRSVGTSIDCTAARDLSSPGGFILSLTVEDSSIHLDAGQKPNMPAVVEDIPSFRTFKATFQVLMRDGQTIQHTAAADPVTGEVVRMDLTLNVVK